jgi:hypothetical protein
MSQPAAADMKAKARRTRIAARNMWGKSEALTGHWMGVHVLVGYHVLPPPAATPRPMQNVRLGVLTSACRLSNLKGPSISERCPRRV